MNTAIRNDTPVESLTGAAGDPTDAPWSGLELLVALLIDELRDLSWMYASAHSKGTIPKPEPIRRPGSERAATGKVISLEEARKLDPRLRGLPDDEAAEKFGRMIHGR